MGGRIQGIIMTKARVDSHWGWEGGYKGWRWKQLWLMGKGMGGRIKGIEMKTTGVVGYRGWEGGYKG